MMIETTPLSSTSLILVAVINNPRDLEIARLLGWYRIPFRSAPKVIVVDYLAFYQTGSFGDEKWRIQYYAPLRGHELTTRIELIHDEPDHPHAHREYFKMQLGPMIRLKEPILADQWRRISFFYTTGELFQGAVSIRDLIVKSEDRPILWQALREKASQAQNYTAAEFPDMGIDPQILAGLLGIRELDRHYGNASQANSLVDE